MDRIAETVAESFPSLVCLALIGAFGRGEGAVITSEKGPEPWNDYDLILVTHTREGWNRLPTLGRTIASELSVRGVDIVPFLPGELRKKASAMMVVDAREGHVVIKGDKTILSDVPKASVTDREALILLLNRMVCLLEAPPESLTGSPPAPLFFTSQLSKAIFAVVDARLVRAGQYATKYREKTVRFLSLPDVGSELKEAVDEAFSFRLSPSARGWGAGRWFLARNEMLTQIGGLLGVSSDSPPLVLARKLWATRNPGCADLLRLLIRGQRPQTGCRAVECAELLVLGAASSTGDTSQGLLLAEAARFMSRVGQIAPPECWRDAASRAVRLWFKVCHG
jgi:hypothetical protein